MDREGLPDLSREGGVELGERSGHGEDALRRASLRVVVFLIFLFWLLLLLLPIGKAASFVTPNIQTRIPNVLATVLALPLAAAFLLFPQKRCRTTEKPVLVWRRFLAFFIDSAAVLPVIVVPNLLLELSIEALHTGEFLWVVERDFARPTDAIVFVAAMVALFGMFCYFWLIPRSGNATIGQFVLGYQIKAADGGRANFAYRTLSAFAAFCVWPVTLFLARKDRVGGEYWWDRCSGTEAVRCD
ncbi:MAG: hypothetical protein CMK07_10120 [Ponticaulis sp.]|nr:hypothetical protein [Ponticaulis sp.]